MKNLFGVCFAAFVLMQLSAFGAAPAPTYGNVVEDFDIVTVVPGVSIDGGTSAEVIKRPDGPTTTDFAWGGYSAGPSGGVNFMRNSAANHPSPPPPPVLTALTFFDASRAVGSYSYTVFDNTPGDGNNNVPSVALNMTGLGAKITVTTVQNGDTGVAVIIRSGDTNWYQSNDTKLLTASLNWHTEPTPAAVDFALTGLGATQWLSLSGTTDLNQVDDGGETAIVSGSEAFPDLGNVTGVGVIITSVAGSTGGFTGLTITEIELDAPDVAVPAAAEHWENYR